VGSMGVPSMTKPIKRSFPYATQVHMQLRKQVDQSVWLNRLPRFLPDFVFMDRQACILAGAENK